MTDNIEPFTPKPTNKRSRTKKSQQGQYSPKSQQNGDLYLPYLYYTERQKDFVAPPYTPDSRMRDAWLGEFWRKEPHLGGVVFSISQIDCNRKWQLTGGRNQVNRYRAVLDEANDGAGFRNFVEKASISYHTSDLGAVIELGRDGMDGPVYGIYTADSTKFKLTGDTDKPLLYYGRDGKGESWYRDDFFLLVNQPSTREEYRGLGWCTVSRAVDFARTMIGINLYELEKLGTQAPEGLLFLHNISQEQWSDAMASRQQQLEAREREWFGGVAVLANSGSDEPPSGNLLSLSDLPANFDRASFEESLMAGYALISGYDPAEFWPVGGSSFGHSTEVATQHMKATGKGRLAFANALEEKMRDIFPASLNFQFIHDDREGRLLEADYKSTTAAMVSALKNNEIITISEARQILAMEGVIPEQWVTNNVMTLESDEKSITTDPNQRLLMRDRALSDPSIRRAIAMAPSEPIVVYKRSYDSPSYEVVLWDSGEEALKRTIWQSAKVESPTPSFARPTTRAIAPTTTAADITVALAIAESRMGKEYQDKLKGK